MSFRYPEDIKGNPHLEELNYIDTLTLKKTIKALTNFFSGVDSMMGIAKDHIAEMRAEMRSHE